MKMKKVVALSLAVVMLMALMCANVSANELTMTRATTDYIYTPAFSAGSWWSGYDAGDIYDLSCTKSSLTGSDVDVYFYATDVTMPANFVRDTTRRGTVEVKENDTLNGNENVCTKTGTFTIKSNGAYRLASWDERSDVNTNVIESNSTLELYIRVYVQTKPGDAQTSIPKDFLCYKFVTTY